MYRKVLKYRNECKTAGRFFQSGTEIETDLYLKHLSRIMLASSQSYFISSLKQFALMDRLYRTDGWLYH